MSETRRSGGHGTSGTHLVRAPAAPRVSQIQIQRRWEATLEMEPMTRVPPSPLTLEEARAAITCFASDEAMKSVKPSESLPRRRTPLQPRLVYEKSLVEAVL